MWDLLMSYQIKTGLSNTKIRHGEIDKKINYAKFANVVLTRCGRLGYSPQEKKWGE